MFTAETPRGGGRFSKKNLPISDLAEALALFIHSYEEAHAKILEARVRRY
jgi:hypothetical protein